MVIKFDYLKNVSRKTNRILEIDGESIKIEKIAENTVKTKKIAHGKKSYSKFYLKWLVSRI